MIVGISGTTLGLVLRSKGRSYRNITRVAMVWGLFLGVISFIIGLISTTTILDAFLAGTFLAGLVSTVASSFVTALFLAIGVGIVAFVSLMIGALVWDLVDLIIKS